MSTNRLVFLLCINTLIMIFVLHPLFLLTWYKGHFLIIFSGLILVISVELISKGGRLWLPSLTNPIYLFFSLPIISVLWSQYPNDTLWHGGLVLSNIAIFFLMMKANTFGLERVISKLIVIVPIVMAITFLIIYMKFGSIRANSIEMEEVVKSIANVGPAMVVLCIPYLILTPHIVRLRFNVWIAMTACLLVVMLSQSRGGMLMFVIVIPLSIYLYPAKISFRIVRLVKVIVAITVITGIMFLSLNVNQFLAPVIERFRNSQLTNSSGFLNPTSKADDFGRALMYSEGINAVYEKPILGIGYGALAPYMEERYGVGIVSHNIIITAWGEMGILGLITLHWLILSVFIGLRKYWRSDIGTKKDKLMAAATLAALLIAFIHAQFRPLFSNPMVPVLLAQAYTMIRLTRKRGDIEANKTFLIPLLYHKQNGNPS